VDDAPTTGVSLQVLARVGGDRELLAEISKLFVEDAPRHLERIRAALDARDGDALRRAAHGLQGGRRELRRRGRCVRITYARREWPDTAIRYGSTCRNLRGACSRSKSSD
jgi:hypothetical protein